MACSLLLAISPALTPHGTDRWAPWAQEGWVTLRPSSGWLQASFWASRSGNFFGWSGGDSWYSVCVLITTCGKRWPRRTLNREDWRGQAQGSAPRQWCGCCHLPGLPSGSTGYKLRPTEGGGREPAGPGGPGACPHHTGSPLVWGLQSALPARPGASLLGAPQLGSCLREVHPDFSSGSQSLEAPTTWGTGK